MDVSEYLLWFLGTFSFAIEQAELIVGKVINKALFWQHQAQTELNKRQSKVLNKMLDQTDFIDGMCTKKYKHITNTSRATAYRELSDLVANGCLVEDKKGRSTAYQLINIAGLTKF